MRNTSDLLGVVELCGDCTVGKLTCPFIIHGYENNNGNGMMCKVITPDDWCRVIIESTRNLPEELMYGDV